MEVLFAYITCSCLNNYTQNFQNEWISFNLRSIRFDVNLCIRNITQIMHAQLFLLNTIHLFEKVYTTHGYYTCFKFNAIEVFGLSSY